MNKKELKKKNATPQPRKIRDLSAQRNPKGGTGTGVYTPPPPGPGPHGG